MNMKSSKVPQLTCFLCCWTLRTGALTIGLLKAVIQLLFAISLFVMYAVHTPQFPPEHPHNSVFGPIIVFVCGLSFLEAYFAIILLHGIVKRKPAYVKIWVVIQFSILIQNLATLVILTIIATISASLHTSYFEYRHLLYVLGTIVVDIYCTLVVYSYYRDEFYRDRSGNIICADILDTLE